ncbi:GGDEF domain-containing protein [Marinomonas flavescens]|uniref:GGDEF domain-containing protein n=1 Tax=Marinomonas flavescens TaxID=2529379 RepID=UPI0014047AC4|nr:GGDEF domain-containing protein [Marinomonas flavescens]
MGDFNGANQPDSQHNDNKSLKVFIRYVFYFGVSGQNFSEQARRILIVNLFSIVGIIFTLPLGIVALSRGNIQLAAVLLVSATLFFANQFYLRATHNYKVSGSIIIYPLYFLMLYLVFSGGVSGTGYVWIFCVPSVSLFIQGMKRGLFEVSVFTLFLILILYFSSEIATFSFQYEEHLKFRIVASFFVVVFLSSIYEYSMSRFNDELQMASKKLKEVAETDLLTGLLNRRGMLQRLDVFKSYRLYLILIDVDYFKKVNDLHGHDCGDFVLSELSRLIKKTLPNSSLSSRWGGEEFLLAINEDSSERVLELVESIRKSIEGHDFLYDKKSLHITASFGVAELSEKKPLDIALKVADRRLYEAKEGGRNQVCF